MVLYSVLFLILAALAPPLILLGIIYRLDQIEREPPGLLWSLFLRGVLAMVPILVLEMLADQFIDFFYWRPMVYLFLAYFVVPGFIEEGIKYRVLRRRTWNEPNFNYRFDGVVYGVFVSLGFAAVENVMYVLTSGFSTAVVRAIFSIPGHAMFGVVMGAALGQARNGLVDDGLIDGGRDVARLRTLVDEGLDVAFGKHAAAAGDGVGAGRALGGLVHLVGTHLQQGSHLVNERAGAAGTAAVHADLGAVGQEQDFCVLAAQLNDAVGAGGQAVGCHAGGENLLHKGHLTAVGQAHAGRAGDSQICAAVGQILCRDLFQKGLALL